VSPDGAFTVVVIALFGNPFSPRYARARRHGPARALDHCAMHVALRGPNGARWSLRERAIPDGARRRDQVVLGGSRFGWDGEGLSIDIDETTTPGGLRMQGRVRIRPETGAAPGAESAESAIDLDPSGDHRWWPVAPIARAEVDFRTPAVRFEGDAYADANAGCVPLESTFASWCWSRARVDRQRAVVAYDVVPIEGAAAARSLAFGPRGMDEIDSLVRRPLAPTAWGLARYVNVDANAGSNANATTVRVLRSLEDGPCYARTLVASRLLGRDALVMHEVLSAERLRRAWVRFLLGFKMGRAP
jgi:carotenoid 1,2-hydratase